MSTEQENFDEILRSKLSEGNFEFNEANWDKAEALIIQADKKRKRRRIGFIFLIGLTLGICLMIPFIGSEKESLKSENKTNNVDKREVEESGSKAEINQISNVPSDRNNQGNNKQINTTQTNETSLRVETGINSEKEDKTVSSNSSQKNASSNVVVFPAEKAEKHIGKSNDAPASQSKNNIDFKKKTQESTNGDNISNNTPSSTNKNNTSTNKEVNGTASQQEQALEEPKTISKTIDTTGVSSTKNKIAAKDTAMVIKDSVATNKKDSVKSVAKDSSINRSTLKNGQRFIYSIDAGVNYALGWTNNLVKEANGFNGILGISATHLFNQHWGALLGIQYNSLAHLSYSSYASSNTQLGFGYTTTYTTITPKILYYVAIPIKLQYLFNKNSISVGANILHLLNTSSTVSTYTQSDFTTSSHATTTKMGYMDGISAWDIQPAVAYRRKIYKGFSVCAEAYYGLIDIKSNSFFGINKFERNSGFKLVLSYSFIK
jgi:hypothetical protein